MFKDAITFLFASLRIIIIIIIIIFFFLLLLLLDFVTNSTCSSTRAAPERFM